MGTKINTTKKIVRAELDGTGLLAYAFVWHWLRTFGEYADGKINGAEFKRRCAKFEGMCVAANAVGYGYTETAVDLTVREVMRKRPLPQYKAAGDQTERDTWEYECVTELREELQKIWG